MKNRHLYNFTRIAALSVTLAAILIACSAEPVRESAQVTLYETPEISVTSSADMQALISRYRGRAIIVNFWATWCPPCVKEMPELANFYREMNREDTAFISISADNPAQIEDVVLPFVNAYEIPFDIHVMSPPALDDLETSLKLDWDGSLPATFLFRPDGAIEQTWIGPVTRQILDEAVLSLSTDTSDGP